jgi:putative endonuclease
MREVTMAAKDELGRVGEVLAADYLESIGIRVLERNWRCSQGEIDIVAQDGGELVIVEVKTRSGHLFGSPFSAITAEKLARLQRLVNAWSREHTGAHHPVRIDAVSVVIPPRGSVEIDHLRGIF